MLEIPRKIYKYVFGKKENPNPYNLNHYEQ